MMTNTAVFSKGYFYLGDKGKADWKPPFSPASYLEGYRLETWRQHPNFAHLRAGNSVKLDQSLQKCGSSQGRTSCPALRALLGVR